MKKIMTLVFGLLLVLIPTSKASAKTLQDYYNELEQLKIKKEQANSNKKLTEQEMNNLEQELIKINSNIKTTKQEIVDATNEVTASEEKIKEKKQETNDYLLFLQLSNSGNTYLEYIFDADDYTDLIYRYAIVNQMSEYNNNLINDLETLIKELDEKKKTLSSKQEKLEKQRTEYDLKLTTLRANLKDIQVLGNDIDDDIAAINRQITYYKNLGCSLNQDVNSCTSLPYAKGWRYPLKSGCVTSEFTGDEERTDYSGGGGHYAIDLGCNPEGTPVYAAAAGVVKRLAFYNCGGQVIYISHYVNGRSYTTVYMHLLKYNVKENQQVTENTIIGYVGGGSTAKQNGGYDGCTTGAHLHFGLAYGDSAYSFESHAFNPREIFRFPYIGGGYFYR